MREIKYKYYFENHAPVVYTLHEIETGLLMTAMQKGFGYVKAKCEYTGLKDKNGVEIYEGDKLRDPDDEGYLLIFWNKEMARFEVHQYGYHMYFNEGGGEEFNNDLSCVDKDAVCMEDIYLYEVIGNIYQHPELLTPKS